MELTVEQRKKIIEALHKIAKITDETPGLTYNITATKALPKEIESKYGIDSATEIAVFVEDELPDEWV